MLYNNKPRMNFAPPRDSDDKEFVRPPNRALLKRIGRLGIPLLLILAALLSCPPSAFAQEINLTSQSYQITSDLDKATVEEIARHMDAVHAEYLRRFAAFRKSRAAKYPLHVYKTRAGYMNFLAKNGIDGSGSGGMFFVAADQSALCTYLEGQSWQRMLLTLQHEGFHQFAWMRIGNTLPPWANEGLAEYFGEAILVKGKLVTGQVPPQRLAILQALTKEKKHLPFKDLLTMDNQRWSARVLVGRAESQYDQSWSIAHFLVQGDRRYQAAFSNYLLNLSQGKDNQTSFEAAFGKAGYAPFEQAWVKYIGELTPSVEKTAGLQVEFLAMGIAALRAEKVDVKSLDELKTQLQSRGYGVTIPLGHGMTMSLSSQDASLFEAPKHPDPKRPTKLEMVVAKDGKLPPSLIVTGLSVTIKLEWREDENGVPMSRINFQ